MLRRFSAIFNNFRLAKKLTFLLLLISLLGISLSGIALSSILYNKAQEEISSNAWLLIQTINSVRSYTDSEVTPKLEAHLKHDEFLPQIIPSFSARKVFDNLQKTNKNYQNFVYKEAMINPSNLQDKADIFEAEIVQKFLQNNKIEEVNGFRMIEGQQFFYVAHPLSITEPKCLQCHSNPDIAPKEMTKIYGKINGFNWKLNEINGAQIVSVPASQVFRNARQSFVVVIGIIAIIFAFTVFIANLWLKRFIVKPIRQISQVAEAVSTGDMNAEFEKVSNDEVGSLVEAFTRMKLSLGMAMRRFEQYHSNPHRQDN